MWEIVSGISGLIVIFLMLYIYQLQRKHKELSYNIIYNAPLFSYHEKILEGVELIIGDCRKST